MKTRNVPTSVALIAGLVAWSAVAAQDVKLVKLNLKAQGLPLTIQAPEGAVAKKQSDYVYVEKGPSFGIRVTPGGIDLAKRKKDVAKDDNTVKFIVDTPDTLFYEFQVVGRKLVRLDMNVKVAGKVYHVSDGQALYNRADGELILKCAKTLAVK